MNAPQSERPTMDSKFMMILNFFRKNAATAARLLVAPLFLLLVPGCGTLTNSRLDAPKKEPFGYVEFHFDAPRFLAQGWTVPISETVDGAKKKYGFLGRDVLLAPLGYTKIRRIPLGVGPHILDLELMGYKEVKTGKPGQVTVNVDVVARKVTPVAVRIDISTISYIVGALRDP